MNRPSVMVIDPALRIAELECFNGIAQMTPLPCSYHLPAMFGQASLVAAAAASGDMASVRGIIILGSSGSVHDRSPWQLELEAWLRPYLERRIPTLGFCYGHQMLAHMFGGKIDFVFPDQHKHLGLRTIDIDATPWLPASRGQLVVSHRECVVAAPAAMRVLARSPEITVDGLAHVDLPIWSFQSHPESTPEFMLSHDIHVAEPARELEFGHNLVRSFLTFVARQGTTP